MAALALPDRWRRVQQCVYIFAHFGERETWLIINFLNNWFIYKCVKMRNNTNTKRPTRWRTDQPMLASMPCWRQCHQQLADKHWLIAMDVLHLIRLLGRESSAASQWMSPGLSLSVLGVCKESPINLWCLCASRWQIKSFAYLKSTKTAFGER